MLYIYRYRSLNVPAARREGNCARHDGLEESFAVRMHTHARGTGKTVFTVDYRTLVGL